MVAVVSGVVGCLVVLRGMSFLGDALSHAMIAGVAGGYLFMKLLFGIEAHAPAMLVGSLIAAILTVALIGFVSRMSRIKEDTAIGIMYTGVFAAGVVADNSDSAMSYFRTVSIEYPRSDWADRSLLRMAELRFAAGELLSAARSAERILLDYPFSDKLARAAYWAGRSRLELGDSERGCSHLRRAAETAAGDVELGNRASYYLQRCSQAAAGPDTTRDAPPARGGRTVFSVQVAAVQSAAAAASHQERSDGPDSRDR